MSRQQRTQNYYRFDYLGEIYEGTINEVSEQIGKPVKNIWSMLDGNYKDVYGECIGKSYPIFDFYRPKSGEYVGTGTMDSMAEQLDVKKRSLSDSNNFKKEFTGEYKIVEDDDMITRRTINKVAPVPVPEKYEPERKIKVVTVKPAEMKPFKVGRYAQSLHDWYFKGWNLKEGQ